MQLLSEIIVALGFIMLLGGFLQKVLDLQVEQLTWIGLGNIAILIGYLMFLREERKKLRLHFLAANPQYKRYEHLWYLYILLAEARHFLIPGQLPGESKLEKWHNKVVEKLSDWDAQYKDYYLLNDKPNLGHRIAQLENTLDWILG